MCSNAFYQNGTIKGYLKKSGIISIPDKKIALAIIIEIYFCCNGIICFKNYVTTTEGWITPDYPIVSRTGVTGSRKYYICKTIVLIPS